MQLCPQFVLNVAEWALIKLLRPVYNVQHNRRNVRAIPPWVANKQRAQRDTGKYVTPHVKGWKVILYSAFVVGLLSGLIEKTF
jgi:hypothetical protein